MLTSEEAAARVMESPVTAGDLRALIAAKASSDELGATNPTETLAQAGVRYLAHLGERSDDEVLPMTAMFKGRGEPREMPSAEYRLAVAVFRDFAD
ncbi:hypothetical protein [Azorhizobium caulinodans]|uniref:hypothetical protein n=1 Tax=Azorhizobium caulinodans TaxID=7 RepID=UPI002FBF10A2